MIDTRVVSAICLMVLLSACVSDGMKGESLPDMSPMRPATDIEVSESGDLLCVTENDDPSTRTCVPRVHEEDGK